MIVASIIVLFNCVDNYIECAKIDIPPLVKSCIERHADKGSVKYLKDGTDCCSARRQLYVMESINATLCNEDQQIEVDEWRNYLNNQLNYNVFGSCDVQYDPNGFICTDATECDC